jgi:hypothetical protein
VPFSLNIQNASQPSKVIQKFYFDDRSGDYKKKWINVSLWVGGWVFIGPTIMRRGLVF